MTEPDEETHFKEHWSQLRKAAHGIASDVETGVADAPHRMKEGTKNALASAAGVRRTPIRSWSPPEGSESAKDG